MELAGVFFVLIEFVKAVTAAATAATQPNIGNERTKDENEESDH